MIKKFRSNNGIWVNSMCWESKYIITINNIRLWTLLEFDKSKNDYKEIKSSFNNYAFLEYLKSNNIKKYFSARDEEILGEV